MNATTTPTSKIAVIGPTQSGKTCLAVGLSLTNTRDFTIKPADVDGKSYLDELKSCIARGVWPDSTNLGTMKEVRFDFFKTGKDPIRVALPEYAGEMLSSDEAFKRFANEHFKDLSGVVLLLNPGATAFQANIPELLEDTMQQYEKVLSFLRDENNGSHNAFVALTVTAADRIKGDLKGKLETFNQSIEELSNTLRTSGVRWKRFEVSITGHLKEQGKPELAKGKKNSAAAPFMWLLDKLLWLPRRQELFKKIRRVALASGVLAVLVGAWCGVDAWNDLNENRRIESELRAAINDCSNRNNPSESDLDAVRTHLVSLRNRTGWFRKQAVASADSMEPLVWNVHEKRIRKEMSAIAENPEENGCNCNRVDKIFNAWIPSVPEVAAERSELKKKWDENKPVYQDKYAVARMLNDIQKTLVENAQTHGKKKFSLFARLYGKLAAITPEQEKSKALKEEISRELDASATKEWKSEVSNFERIASTNATYESTHELVKSLEDWVPVTTNGIAEKAKLLVSVTNSAPNWRKAYFTTQITSAVTSREMAKLAALHPGRIATNDYLTAAWVSTQWTQRIERAFNSAYTNYLSKFSSQIIERSGSGRPKFTDDDRKEIRETARTVGYPFDAKTTQSEVEKIVADETRKWDARVREECRMWVKENITDRPNRPRTGRDGIFDAYVSERRKSSGREDIFNEIVRDAVYRKVEEWFEADVNFFREGKEGAEARFQDMFKPLYERVYEDLKYDPKSWAHFFAATCKDRQITAGFSHAFPLRFEITEIKGAIYRKSGAPSDFKELQISVKDPKNESLFNGSLSSSDVIRNSDEEHTCLWSGTHEVMGSQFSPPRLNVDVLIIRDKWRNKEHKENYDIELSSFDKDLSGMFPHTKWSRAWGVQYPISFQITLKRTEGSTIGELLAKAKSKVASEQK